MCKHLLLIVHNKLLHPVSTVAKQNEFNHTQDELNSSYLLTL